MKTGNLTYIIISLVALCSCNNVSNFYQGRVVDKDGKPIEGVVVAEDDIKKHTRTNKDGYFKLNRSPDWLGDLVFIKDGYQNDTIPSVWHQSGETIKYNFVEDDTTVVRLISK